MGSIKSFKAANHHVLCCPRPRKHVGIFLINQNLSMFKYSALSFDWFHCFFDK